LEPIRWSVPDKIEDILALTRRQGAVGFSRLFQANSPRGEIIVTFLALLELIRLKQLACVQPEPFAEIEISKAVASTVPAEMVEPARETEVENEVKSAPPSPEPTAAETEEEEVEDEFDDEDEDDEDEDEEAGDDDQQSK